MLISGRITQGWLWSRLPLTAANFVIEVEFKVRYSHSSLDVPFFFSSFGRYPAAPRTSTEMASRYGLRRSVRSQGLCSAARVSNTLCLLLQTKQMNTIFRLFHRNRDLPRYVRILYLHILRVGTYGVPWRRYKNDLESDYPFPRVIAMQGDGKTSYDVGKDGVPTMIGECTVRADVIGMSLRFPNKQYRQTIAVAT